MPPVPLSQISLVEELAANALPPMVVQTLDGWRLRFNSGVTRRANSVLASGHGGRYTVEEKLEHARAFYARWDSNVRFQLNPSSQPSGLDEMLAERGYVKDGAVHVQTASVDCVLASMGERTGYRVRLEPALNAPWYALYAETEGADAHKAEVRRTMFSRIPSPAAYVLVEIDGQPAAVGLGVLERGHVGVFNMATRAEFRRRGAATAVLRALAAWGRAQGAWAMYLQVAEENGGARSVYERFGFRTLYQYHYREAP